MPCLAVDWGPIRWSELGALTREEGNIGVFRVVWAAGHAADVVPEGLQCVHLQGGQGLSDRAPVYT